MINRTLYDAWKIKPPCEYEGGQCHNEYSYITDCGNEDEEDEEDEDYVQNFSND